MERLLLSRLRVSQRHLNGLVAALEQQLGGLRASVEQQFHGLETLIQLQLHELKVSIGVMRESADEIESMSFQRGPTNGNSRGSQ